MVLNSATPLEVEVVVITYPRDFALARVLLRSLKLYCHAISKIHVVVATEERRHWVNIEGLTVNLVAKEALLPQEQTHITGYKKQMLLKFLSHQLIRGNFFWILDSDMLLLKPLTTTDLGLNSRIPWYYSPWNPVNSIYKKECEEFLGFPLLYSFMEDPFYLFRKDVLLDFLSRYDLAKLMGSEHPSEFICYGGFCYKYYQHFYQFIATADATFAKCLNQIPPSYLELDETVSLEKNYPQTSIVAIYSHWYLALAKMIEFYHDSQEINFGAIRDKVTPGIPDYRLVQNQINTKYFKGLYSDGWVEQALSISLPADFAETSLAFTFEVMEPPADTAIIAGDLQCTLSTPFNKPLLYKLRRGSNLLRVALPRMVAAGTLQIHFEGGFKVRDNADQRTFYARLTSCVLEEKGFKNRIQRLLHSLSLSSGAISCEG